MRVKVDIVLAFAVLIHAQEASLLDRADLDNTTLGKLGHLAITHGMSVRPCAPSLNVGNWLRVPFRARQYSADGRIEAMPMWIPSTGKHVAAMAQKQMEARNKDSSAGQTEALPKLKCKEIGDGILKITGLPPDLQSNLLRAVFPPDAHGVCGGLYEKRSGKIEVGGKDWSVTAGSEVSWSELGLHGSHTVQWGKLQGSLVEAIWNAIKEASPQAVLDGFRPDSVRVAFEIMHGRTIPAGDTLCGWSRDNDRVDDKDTSPKILILGGKAKIRKGFKSKKEDQESLDVDLNPGDVLILHGPARSLVSAVNGLFKPNKAPASRIPFDFVHIWLQDHRRLGQKRPKVYKAIHDPPTPVSGSNEYKWMQYAYTVLDKPTSNGEMMVRMSDGTSVKRKGKNARSKLSALEPRGKHVEFSIGVLFGCVFMIALIGIKKFRSFQKPLQPLLISGPYS